MVLLLNMTPHKLPFYNKVREVLTCVGVAYILVNYYHDQLFFVQRIDNLFIHGKGVVISRGEIPYEYLSVLKGSCLARFIS